MAKVIDTRNAGGQLVILGDNLVLPTSNAAANSTTFAHVAGGLRYNPTLDRVEFLSNTSLTWLATGMNEAITTQLINEIAPPIANAAAIAALSNGITFADGSAAAPGIYFSNSASTGLARVSNSIVLSAQGVAGLTANSTTVTLNLPATLTGNTTPSANATLDLGSPTRMFNRVYANSVMVNEVIANSVTALSNQNTQNIFPALDNTYDIGDSGNRFKAIYAVTFHGTATSARYADLAERYHADSDYETGTVLVIGGPNEVTISNSRADHRVAGIVSSHPALMMNSEAGTNTTHPYLALRGRVPCKVVGPIHKGDLLVTSDVPGHAQAGNAETSPCIVAKALEDFDGDIGVIEVLV